MKENNGTPQILISACLLGERVRYDGGSAKCEHPTLERWRAEGRLISTCPEVEGGGSIPRPPAEIIGGDGGDVLDGAASVLEINGRDTTQGYLCGAQKTLQVAEEKGIRIAILKAYSPSCGHRQIYDGSFTATLKPGQGVAAALLKRNGIHVFNEEEIQEAEAYLRTLGE
jgi:uncharacterized protein YbbK (DUF523 family)